jgi:hypothetical protein
VAGHADTGYHATPAGQAATGRRAHPGTVGWSGADDATQEFGVRVLMQNRVERLTVSGKPPWDPAPKPSRLGR